MWPRAKFNKNSRFQIKILQKQIVPCKSAGRKVSFKWSYHRFSSTDSKVRTTLQNSFIPALAVKGLISDRPFNIGDRRDFDIVENTERLNQLPRLQNSRVFCSQGKASLQFSLGWFALWSSAKPRFDRLKRELLEVYNIILKFHEV